MKRLRSFMLPLMCLAPVGWAAAQEGSLPRQVYWGATALFDEKSGAPVVRRVRPDSPAETAGIRPGDLVLQVNGKAPADQPSYNALFKSTRAGEPVELLLSREGRRLGVRLTPVPLPKETLKGVSLIHDSVVTERGHRVRTIVTRPENARGRLPAVLLVPWLSCDSVEWPFGPPHGIARTLHGIAERSGFVLLRVEKPGVGDSEGPDCSTNDLRTDMAAYTAALRALKKYDFVDAGNIFLLGASLGGALAPVIAEGENVRGLIVTGGFAKTWYEHMLEHERTRLALTGQTPAEINQAMRGYSEFYSLYLNQKLAPADVLRQRPHLARLWYGEPGGQYGRPAAFYQQAQELNVEGAWGRVSAPVLVVYGEHDWIMSRADHELIAEIVNRRRPGAARLVVLPKTSHSLDVHDTVAAAFKGEAGRFDEGVVTLMIDWLKGNTDTAAVPAR